METILVSGLIPVSPQRVYAAWLDSSEHTSFTGGSKAEIEPKPGGRFKGQDGDIEGEIIELTPDQRILMSWRSRDFPAGAPDSRVEISLQPYAEADCQITIEHSEVPEAVAERFKREWIDRYVIPMRSYFQQLTASTARAEQAQRRVEEAERKLEAVLAAAPSEKTSKPSTKAAARGKTSAKKTTAPSPIKPDAKAARGTTDLASTEDEAQPAAPSATKALKKKTKSKKSSAKADAPKNPTAKAQAVSKKPAAKASTASKKPTAKASTAQKTSAQKKSPAKETSSRPRTAAKTTAAKTTAAKAPAKRTPTKRAVAAKAKTTSAKKKAAARRPRA